MGGGCVQGQGEGKSDPDVEKRGRCMGRMVVRGEGHEEHYGETLFKDANADTQCRQITLKTVVRQGWRVSRALRLCSAQEGTFRCLCHCKSNSAGPWGWVSPCGLLDLLCDLPLRTTQPCDLRNTSKQGHTWSAEEHEKEGPALRARIKPFAEAGVLQQGHLPTCFSFPSLSCFLPSPLANPVYIYLCVLFSLSLRSR